MDYGLWIMDYGLWIMDYRLWTFANANANANARSDSSYATTIAITRHSHGILSKDDVTPQDIFRLSKESSASRAVVATMYNISDRIDPTTTRSTRHLRSL